MKRLITVLALGLWSLTAQAALPTHAFTLDNGLKAVSYTHLTLPTKA